MRSKDLKPTLPAKVLVVGEDSNLQWSDTVTEVAMFADYFFREFPEDDGERSRNVEARNLFKHISYVTNNHVRHSEAYITNLCNDYVTPPLKGKRVLIPEENAVKGLSHIEWILNENPTIKYVLVMSLQANYWLQKLGFYGGDDETFLHGAQPRRKGLENQFEPFYQPVDGKAFRSIIGNIYEAKKFPVKVIPILANKNYPLMGRDEKIFGEAYAKIREAFSRF